MPYIWSYDNLQTASENGEIKIVFLLVYFRPSANTKTTLLVSVYPLKVWFLNPFTVGSVLCLFSLFKFSTHNIFHDIFYVFIVKTAQT